MTSLYERGASQAKRIAVISAHTSPLAALGGRETGGMNVYVRELSRELGARGYAVDVFTRRASPAEPDVQPFGPNARVINVDAGPADTIDKNAIPAHLDEFERNILDFAVREGVAEIHQKESFAPLYMRKRVSADGNAAPHDAQPSA